MEVPSDPVLRRDRSSTAELFIYGLIGALSGLLVAALMMAIFLI
jgi:hypothetical protein